MKKCVIITLSAVLSMLFLGGIYLVYDNHKTLKPIQIQIPTDNLKTQLSDLACDYGEPIAQEHIYRHKNNKALMHISVSEATHTLQKQFTEYIEMGKYQYIKVDTSPATEMVITDWQYMPLLNVILSNIGLEQKDHGNWYASHFGEDQAKGKPNYRYSIDITIEKGENRYFVRCYCNRTDFLGEIVDEIAALYTKDV